MADMESILISLCEDTNASNAVCKTRGKHTQNKGKRRQLKHPLENWQVLAQDSERLWTFHYSNKKNILYRSFRNEWHQQGSFTFDCHQGMNVRTFGYEKFESTTDLPLDSVPVDEFNAVTGWRISFYQQLVIPTKPIVPIKSFLDHLFNQQDHIAQYYTEVEFHIAPIALYEQLKSTRIALIGTDGGAIPLKGISGFAVADDDGNILLNCYRQPS